MNSLAWPKMFDSGTYTGLYEDKEAIKSNLLLLLNCERSSLFGDPFFGGSLNQIKFQQNTAILADLVIDELYTLIQTYIPQLYVSREDIKIYQNREVLSATIRVTYRIDNTSDLYYINLTNTYEEG